MTKEEIERLGDQMIAEYDKKYKRVKGDGYLVVPIDPDVKYGEVGVELQRAFLYKWEKGRFQRVWIISVVHRPDGLTDEEYDILWNYVDDRVGGWFTTEPMTDWEAAVLIIPEQSI